jgi:hypothetical protein
MTYVNCLPDGIGQAFEKYHAFSGGFFVAMSCRSMLSGIGPAATDDELDELTESR